MKPKILLVVTGVITLAFAIAVAFNISPYLRGPAEYFPDWRWQYNFVNTYARIWVPLFISSLILFMFYRTEKQGKAWNEKHQVKTLTIFFILSFLFQFALLFVNRAGINGLLNRIINPGINGYFSTAIHIASLPDFFITYNVSVLSFSMHAQGHPPFAILFFYFINSVFQYLPFLNFLLHGISPHTHSIYLIWNTLHTYEKLGALFSAIFIPFLVSLSSLFVYFLGKKLYGIKTALRSLVLFLFIPNVLLFIPINDAFISIFPLISLLILLRGIEKKSSISYFLSGLIFSVGIFFSISLLPLLIIFGLIILKKLWKQFTTIFRLGIIFLMGLILIPVILFCLFRFNSIEMLGVLLKGLPEQRSYMTWVFYNLYDFFSYTGIPLAVISIYLFISQTKLTISKNWKKIDVLFVSFVLMLFTLNFSGSVRGEVARIWIPFVPFYVLPLVNFLTKNKFKTGSFIIFLLLQLLLVLVINEYWVAFW